MRCCVPSEEGTTTGPCRSDQRLSFARAISPDPFAAGLVTGMGKALDGDPMYDVLRSGGSLLELGCGVAGRVLVMLQAIPAMQRGRRSSCRPTSPRWRSAGRRSSD